MPRQISNGLDLVPRSPQLLIEGPRCTDCEALWDGCAIFTNKHKLYLSCFQFAVQLTSCGDLDPNNSTQKWHFIINLLEHRRGRNCHQGCFFFFDFAAAAVPLLYLHAVVNVFRQHFHSNFCNTVNSSSYIWVEDDIYRARGADKQGGIRRWSSPGRNKLSLAKRASVSLSISLSQTITSLAF